MNKVFCGKTNNSADLPGQIAFNFLIKGNAFFVSQIKDNKRKMNNKRIDKLNVKSF